VTAAAGDAAQVSYRLAELADIEQTYEVFIDAASDLNRKNGRAAEAGTGSPPARAMSFRRAMLRNDPERYWVAEAGGRMVGFAMATLREDVWYLAALHVLPEYQAHGVGRELLRRSSAGAAAVTVRIVLSDTINPISNGLYMKTGMLHQDAILIFDGLPSWAAPEAAGPLATREFAQPADLAVVTDLDRAVVGYGRAVDHEFWNGIDGLAGRVLLRDGEFAGYAYASAAGHLGPVAVTDPHDLPAALDVAADLADAAGAGALHLRTCGAARSSAAWALARGLRLTGIGLLLSSQPLGRLEGYVTSGGDALF
jgi:GNAT superfamily N-acetyltransferase